MRSCVKYIRSKKKDIGQSDHRFTLSSIPQREVASLPLWDCLGFGPIVGSEKNVHKNIDYRYAWNASGQTAPDLNIRIYSNGLHLCNIRIQWE